MTKTFISISASFVLVLFGSILEAQTTYVDGVTGGTMVLVQGGTFDMGSDMGSKDSQLDERPVHRVTLSDYYIGETEVTQAQWQAVMGDNPSKFQGCDNCPVEKVSWDDVQTFLSRLNARSGGARYRLPTEAEWEYAARGGAKSLGYTYAGSNNIDEVAWYNNNMGTGKTHSVKGKKANELGLYDMSGNVWEFCADWYDDYPSGPVSNPTGPAEVAYRVLRGGSWRDRVIDCRVARRNYLSSVLRGISFGFRVARSPQ